jgi:tRNA (guanine37-N1)-methyltransferase
MPGERHACGSQLIARGWKLPILSVMLRVDVLTLFPAAFAGPLDVSIIGRARETGLLDLHLHDIRVHATDRHRSVDDYPFGGGQGMVLRVDVLDRALEHVRADGAEPGHVVYLSPQGQRLDDRLVRELAAEPRLILVCGRYEGIDERFIEHCVDREVSIGDYVLTGGELPAMVLIDAVARHIPGALGDEASSEDESFATGLLEYPHYTRPAEYRGWAVPAPLLGGDHAAIERWKRRESLLRTARRRPDLLPDAAAERPAFKAAGAKVRTYVHESDYDAVYALWQASRPGVALRPSDERDEIARKLARDPELFIVAASGRRIVGAVMGGWDGRRGHVYHLAVAPGWRGKGLGTALMSELEERFRLKGCLRMNLLVAEGAESAADWYEHMGWVRTGATAMAKDVATGG